MAAQGDAVVEFYRVLAVSCLVIISDSNIGIAGEFGCFCSIVSNFLHIPDIGPIGGDIVLVGGRIDAAAHISHLVAAVGNLVPVDDHVLGFICFIVGDGNAAIILDGLARGDRSQVF